MCSKHSNTEVGGVQEQNKKTENARRLQKGRQEKQERKRWEIYQSLRTEPKTRCSEMKMIFEKFSVSLYICQCFNPRISNMSVKKSC